MSVVVPKRRCPTMANALKETGGGSGRARGWGTDLVWEIRRGFPKKAALEVRAEGGEAVEVETLERHVPHRRRRMHEARSWEGAQRRQGGWSAERPESTLEASPAGPVQVVFRPCRSSAENSEKVTEF